MSEIDFFVIEINGVKAELERAKARQQTVKAKVMKRKRSSTVEPVIGYANKFCRNEKIECKEG